ncbi:MAG: hypothetical protein ACYC4U_05040 [Pirellulaceae bacterium]
MLLRMMHFSVGAMLLVSTAANAWSAPQDAPNNSSADDPAVLVKDLAVFESFRLKVAAHSFALPDDKVRHVVVTFLRKNAAESPKIESPKTMPTAEQLETDLDVGFESLWNKLIEDTTTELDPEGRQALAERLRLFLLENTKLRAETEREHDDFLKKDLPKALDRVKEQMVQEQSAALVEALKKVTSPEMPGQQMVNDALAGDKTPAVDTLTRAVVKSVIDEELRDTLLVESYQALSEATADVVLDGVAQLEEQLQLLEKPPEAISQPGIEKEVEGRLQRVAASQHTRRRGDPLRPSYGVFLRATQEVPAQALRWFDQRVADIGNRMWEKVATAERPFPNDDNETLRQLILADLPAHHQPSASSRAAQATIQSLIDRYQPWIVDDLVKALQKSKSADDRSYAEASFRQDATSILNAEGSQSHAAWSTLRNTLKKRYETELLRTVRNQIADQQARQYAPALMDNNWRPTEADLNIQIPFERETLADLRVWSTGPPSSKEKVLQETWDLWASAAREALEVAQDARDGQLQIVQDLKPEIHERIRQDQTRNHDAWVEEYSRVTVDKWRVERNSNNSRRASAAAWYPDLFSTTTALIEQIVAELLPLVESERNPIEPSEPAMHEEPEQPPTSQELLPTEPPVQDPESPTPSTSQEETEESGAAGKSENAAESAAGGGQDETGSGKEEAEDESSEESADEESEAEGAKGEDEGKKKTKEAEGGGKKKGSKQDGKRKESASVSAAQRIPTERDMADLLFHIAFWTLLILVLLMATCWYYHVRYLRRLLTQYRRTSPLSIR